MRLGRLPWCQRIGGALKGCRLVEHVPAIAFVTQMLGGLAELVGALAIDGGAADGEGLGHWCYLAQWGFGHPVPLGLPISRPFAIFRFPNY